MDRARGRTSMGNCRIRKLGVCVSVVILGTFIACMLLAYTAFASLVTERDTLQQVVFLFRHGDRTPTETYPKDPHINYDWPNGWGSLTKKGMRQLYNMGQWIRLKYGPIIGRKFESTATLIRSSYADRCVMSALALLAGLFTPSPEDMFVPGLTWTPVPVHSTPRELDKLIVMKAPCPKLEAALKQAYIEEEKKSGEKMAEYYKKLTQHTGQNMSTITDVEFLYNTLEIEEQHDLQLPAWTQNFYNDEMREIAARSLAIFTEGTIQKRLRGGPLLKEILHHMEESKDNLKSKRRSYFYSAHDITIVNVMRSMGFTNELLKPDYGAMIILELHFVNNGADQEVKALYLNNTEMDNAHRLEIPNCTSPCLLQNLKQVWHEVIPDDWDAECKMSALALASVALCQAHPFILDRRIRAKIVNMFSWLSREENSKQDLFENVTEGLKRIYKSKLLPLEQYYQFHDFHSPQLDDPDFDAKPMILLVGQYSTGKTTFIKYLLEREFPGIRIGPEPTTDRFIAVMYDEKEGVIPGNALVVDPNKQFRPLSKFGNAFLNRFQCSTVASPVLKGISIVDTPGILSGEKQRVDRGYDFTGVLEWFAERVDRIILLFDAHKLDISDEFRRSIEALRGHDDKIRIVLNKADMIDHQQLMRVYGALMWSLGKVLQTPEVARVYIGSFWDQPLRYDVNRRLFEDEEQDLFRDMQSLPKNAALRKLNDLIKRARLAKVHAYIISALRKDMPSMFGKDTKKKELIKNLGQTYDQIQREQKISPGDFPDLKKMQESLAHHDFNKFNPLKPKLLEVVDKMLAEDIAKLMAMIPHEEVTTVSETLTGGAFEGVKDQVSPFGYKRGEGIDAGAGEPEWIVNKERYKYDSMFESLGPQDGKITGAAAKSEMVKSKLPNSVLGKIWKLSDINKDGFLDSDEFALAMHLINIKLEGYDLPAELPEHLIPPSKRDT
ncbi:PREDICTED: EH domain-containing protein 3 [Trachymyrmex septentrionalis]|uniref:EH domain-containing protein 3 n=1 Tax=Trachymyrmex septentrionalis TaxID=34720 RepID=UPI00084F1ED7|nr:PREDICTED: EH domain-containing protein 3 [Trachymyrmex septentrionalis]